jgi:hypothetical protein
MTDTFQTLADEIAHKIRASSAFRAEPSESSRPAERPSRRTVVVDERYGQPTVEEREIELKDGATLRVFQSSLLAGQVEVWRDGERVHVEIYGGRLADLFCRRAAERISLFPAQYV